MSMRGRESKHGRKSPKGDCAAIGSHDTERITSTRDHKSNSRACLTHRVPPILQYPTLCVTVNNVGALRAPLWPGFRNAIPNTKEEGFSAKHTHLVVCEVDPKATA